MPVIPAEITRNNPSDTYALLDELVIRGGFKSVADVTERDALPTDVRSEGMFVYLVSVDEWYQLQGGITNGDWVQITFGGGGGFDGNPSSLNQEGATRGEAIIWNDTAGEWQPLPILSNTTGVITGGEVTINGGDNTKFDVAAGSGWIIDWTTPTAPTKKYITWPQFLAVTLPNLGSTLFTAVSIQESATPNVGELVLQNSLLTPNQRRSLISLQSVVHTNQTNITSIGSSSKPAYEITEALLDYVNKLGSINEGNQFVPNGANLSVDKELGQTTFPFINRSVDPQNPTEKIDPAISVAGLTRYYQDGVGGFTVVPNQTVIDPENYDDGSGTLATMTNNRFQIKRVYFFGVTETEAITYGQAQYQTLEEAKLNIFLEDPVISPLLQNGVFVTAIIVKKGVTDLTAAVSSGDAAFVPITSEAVGGSGTVQDLQTVLDNGSEGIVDADISIASGTGDVNNQTTLGIRANFLDLVVATFSGSQINNSSINMQPAALTLEARRAIVDDGTARLDLLAASGGQLFFSGDALTGGAMKYSGDYSANFVDRSLVDKAYVDALNTLQKVLESGSSASIQDQVEISSNDGGINNVGILRLDEAKFELLKSSININGFTISSIEADSTQENIVYLAQRSGGTGSAKCELIQYPGGLNIVMTGVDSGGFRYSSDYSSFFTERSIVDKGYADGAKVVQNTSVTLPDSAFRKQPSEYAMTTSSVATYTISALSTPLDGGRIEINQYNATGVITLDFSAVTMIDSEAQPLTSPLVIQAAVVIYDLATDTYKLIGKYS